MDRSLAAEKNRHTFLGDTPPALAESDPDFAAMRDRLMYGEIADRGTLDTRQRALITLVVLTASQTLDDMALHTTSALRLGVSPVEIKEAVYQCAPYIGFPKTESALRRVNAVFTEHGIALPLQSQSIVTEASRFADGLAVQKSIFGDTITNLHASAPQQQRDILVNYLSAFCFGDIYTRTGLDLKTRELLTFSIISALGGCEAQVKAHVQGNAAVGNSKQNLIDALAQMLPLMGFPRTLNALGCVNAMLQEAPMNNITEIFPRGEANTAYANYFTGNSYLNMLSTEGVVIGNVTFEPGCRNHWHVHHSSKGGGQILLCTAGRGWYQEWGKPARELHAGDVVNIPAGVRHWHGAAKDSWFVHLAVEVTGENTRTEWLEPVSEADYTALP